MNHYNGEKTITLYGKVYPMKIDMGVIGEFNSETGKDYMHTAVKAMNAYVRAKDLFEPLAVAEIMTGAVSMSDAAWLFYLAAKKMDKSVTFDEIQEAVLLEGPMKKPEDDEQMSYPLQFVSLVTFSILGASDESKKP